MNANEVVIHEMQRHGVRMVFHLLRESIRQSRHAARVHADIEIVPLGIGRADMLHVGVALDPHFLRASAFSWAVATLGTLGSLAVGLHEHGIINVRAERAFDCLKVRLMAIAGELNAVREAIGKIGDKVVGALGIAAPDKPNRNQLRIGARGNPKPSVALFASGLKLRVRVLRLGADKAPNFVDLNALAFEVAKNAILIPRAGLAGVHDQLRNRRLADTREPGNSADRHALAKEMKDLGALGFGQLVHADHYA